MATLHAFCQFFFISNMTNSGRRIRRWVWWPLHPTHGPSLQKYCSVWDNKKSRKLNVVRKGWRLEWVPTYCDIDDGSVVRSWNDVTGHKHHKRQRHLSFLEWSDIMSSWDAIYVNNECLRYKYGFAFLESWKHKLLSKLHIQSCSLKYTFKRSNWSVTIIRSVQISILWTPTNAP